MSETIQQPIPSDTLIATLDLLGVTQMICNAKDSNDLVNIYSSISKVYKLVQTQASAMLSPVAERLVKKGSNAESVKKMCDAVEASIQSNYFSDTIVISLHSSDKKNFSRISTTFFFFYVKAITYRLFAHGFPVRGCIDVGDVLRGENLVIGKPYVNSLQKAERLEFSGVVVTDEAFKIYNTMNDKARIVCPLSELPIPVKGGYVTAMCLNWLLPNEKSSAKILNCGIEDLEQLLYEKFSANGKVMGEAAVRKLSNTAMTVRAFLAQNKALDRKV